MGKAKPKTGVREFLKFGASIAFVLNSLDSGQAEELELATLSADDLLSFVDRAGDVGFSVSCKFDTYSKCWQATMICNEVGAVNEAMGVSGRSSHGYADALVVCWYKLAVIAEWNLRPFIETEGKQRRRS